MESDCASGAQTIDVAWWELVPPYAEVDFNSMSVSPGDEIEASVYEKSDSSGWVTRVDDLTTGISGVMVTGGAFGTVLDSNPNYWLLDEGSTAGVSYAGGYSAEWIAEDPTESDGSTLAPLADYGTVTFTNLTTSLSAWSLTSGEAVEIVQNGSVLSVPSGPDSTGGGFSVTYTG